MSDDETFPLTLGGRLWALPHFPFGIVKKLQPRLLRRNRELVATSMEAGFALTEEALDDLAGIVVDAVRVVDAGFTREALDAMHFPIVQLLNAQTPIMQACGLELTLGAPGGAAPDPKA